MRRLFRPSQALNVLLCSGLKDSLNSRRTWEKYWFEDLPSILVNLFRRILMPFSSNAFIYSEYQKQSRSLSPYFLSSSRRPLNLPKTNCLVASKPLSPNSASYWHILVVTWLSVRLLRTATRFPVCGKLA